MQYYVYIIRSKSTGKFYTGLTNDIIRRVAEHNGHYSSTKTTKKIADFELLFVQVCQNRDLARKLEKYLKSGFGREIRGEIVKYISF